MKLGDLTQLAKRTANIDDFTNLADQMAVDILSYITFTRAKMWRFNNWNFGRLLFNLSISSGVTDYSVPSTIGRIESISDGDGGIIYPRSMDYYFKNMDAGSMNYYTPIGLDALGNEQIRIFGTPSVAVTLPCSGIHKLSVYSITDVANNAAMDFFPADYDDILMAGVLSSIYESKKEVDLARGKQAEFLKGLTAMVPESENFENLPTARELPDYIIDRIERRNNGEVC